MKKVLLRMQRLTVASLKLAWRELDLKTHPHKLQHYSFLSNSICKGLAIEEGLNSLRVENFDLIRNLRKLKVETRKDG